MKLLAKILAIALILSLFAGTAAAQDYILGPGDVLNISVWGFEELRLEQTAIRPDGKIAFPLAGDIEAKGLSPLALSGKIQATLNNYVKNPIVTVNVVKFRTTRIYVLGEVAKPGLYELEKHHNLLDAIGIAGGYTKDAAKKKVFVIRKDQTDKPHKVNLLALLEKADTRQNVVLNEGDVVYLTKSNKISFAKDIMPFITGAYYISELQDN